MAHMKFTSDIGSAVGEKTAQSSERCKWHGYRGSEHAWSALSGVGMHRSRCGYVVRTARLTEPTGRRCALCAHMADKSFATPPSVSAAGVTKRLQDVRKVRDHVCRAVRILKAMPLGATAYDEALLKLASVEADLVGLFRLASLPTRDTADDRSFGEPGSSRI